MKEVKMTLNDKGIGLVIGVISALILSLGIMCGMAIERGMNESTEQWFTMEEAEKIRQFQLYEDKENSGRMVVGRYDEDGHFVIRWGTRGEFDNMTLGANTDWD